MILGCHPNIKRQDLLSDNLAFNYTVKNSSDSLIMGGENAQMPNRTLPQEPERKPATGISTLLGKTITVIGYEKFRGTKTQHTKAEDVGEDGLTDYCLIDTNETYNVKDGKYNRFFVNPKTIGRLLDAAVSRDGEITESEPLIVEVYTEKGGKNAKTYLRTQPTQEKLSN